MVINALKFWFVVAVAFSASITGVSAASKTATVHLLAELAVPKLPTPQPKTTLTEYGKSLPPLAYVAFCARAEGQSECNTKGSVERLIMTSDKMDQLNQVNKYVNTKIKPMSDLDQYGVPDYWTYPVTAGDCEDYQLLKKRYLVQLGFAADELLMTVVFDENGDGHAVLTIMAQDGDYILDNRRNEILLWNQTGYKFLKRESQQNPRQWVSLRQSAPQVLVGSKTQ
jgi:predicted transglutaminase-like cysteine proteinase